MAAEQHRHIDADQDLLALGLANPSVRLMERYGMGANQDGEWVMTVTLWEGGVTCSS